MKNIDPIKLHQDALPIFSHASEIALENFNKIVEFEIKEDFGQKSVVTKVDKELDSYLSNELTKLIPGSGYVSEESGVHLGKEYNWIIDPLDGTANYQKGVELWGIFISLKRKGKTIYAVMLFPALFNKIYYGFSGKGVFDEHGDKMRIKKVTGYKVKYSVDSSDPVFKKQAGNIDFDFRTSVMFTGSVAFNAYCMVKGAYDFFIAYRLASYDCDAIVFLAEELGLKVIFYSETATDKEIAITQTQKLLISKPDIYNEVDKVLKPWISDYEKRNN